MIRSKMGSAEGKASVDKARDAFARRAAAAASAPPAAAATDIDWSAYAKQLPDFDIAAMQRDYERFAGAIPALTYDAAADAANHATSERAWAGFEAFCKGRATELEALAAEQKDHKLHRWYRRARVWQR